jgi:hypothetical protein
MVLVCAMKSRQLTRRDHAKGTVSEPCRAFARVVFVGLQEPVEGRGDRGEPAGEVSTHVMNYLAFRVAGPSVTVEGRDGAVPAPLAFAAVQGSPLKSARAEGATGHRFAASFGTVGRR